MTIFALWQEYKRQRELPDTFARFHDFAGWCDEQRRLACIVATPATIEAPGPATQPLSSPHGAT